MRERQPAARRRDQRSAPAPKTRSCKKLPDDRPVPEPGLHDQCVFSGYVAPQMVRLLRDVVVGYQVPMIVASLFMLSAAICILLSPRAAFRPDLAPATARRR